MLNVVVVTGVCGSGKSQSITLYNTIIIIYYNKYYRYIINTNSEVFK